MTPEEQLEEAKRIVKEADELIKKEPKRQPTFAESCKSAYDFWHGFWLECKTDKDIFYFQMIIIGGIIVAFYGIQFICKLMGIPLE